MARRAAIGARRRPAVSALAASLAAALVGGAFASLAALPAWAASALSAWRISRDGVLELRTTPGVPLQAYFEEGIGGRGPRLWIDLPGAPIRPRSIPGGGALREVRIGKPDPTTTRLVLEFLPGTRLDPRQLRLVGTARDRWRMEISGLQPGTRTYWRLVPAGPSGDLPPTTVLLVDTIPPPPFPWNKVILGILTLLLAGILTAQWPAVVKAFARQGFRLHTAETGGEWTSGRFERRTTGRRG